MRVRVEVRARVEGEGEGERISWGVVFTRLKGAVQQVHSDDTVIPRQLG